MWDTTGLHLNFLSETESCRFSASVSHISRKTSEIWATLRSVAGIAGAGVSFIYSLRTNLEVGMNRVSSLPLAFLLLSTFAVAQQPATLHLSEDRSAGCPVDMEARHATQTPVSMNAGGENAPDNKVVPQLQRLHLTLTNPSSRDIVSAQFTAHGFSKKPRAMDLSSGSNETDLAKTIDIALGVKGKGHASHDLSLNHFTAVTSIDLNSISYADGTTWRAPSPGACSITPSGVMLVAAN
jgi:hypothetical protein